MRELPRQLTADELAELFEGHTRFVERLAAEEDPLVRARTLVHELPADEKKEILDTHPADRRARRAVRAQRRRAGRGRRPAVLAELARLNAEYEARHGFRFVVFVNRRPKAEILAVLKSRIEQSDRSGARNGARRARRDRGGPLVLAVDPYLIGWLDLVFRWFHVAAAIVWIGTSFYFVALDNHLREPEDTHDRERGVGGETWEIHGGGFYRVEKFRVAPRAAARDAALVQVGGVLDVDLRLHAARRPLLPRAAHVSDRPAVGEPRAVGGDRDLARRPRRRLGRLRPSLPHDRRGGASSRWRR